jgi:hypothetical protein
MLASGLTLNFIVMPDCIREREATSSGILHAESAGRKHRSRGDDFQTTLADLARSARRSRNCGKCQRAGKGASSGLYLWRQVSSRTGSSSLTGCSFCRKHFGIVEQIEISRHGRRAAAVKSTFDFRISAAPAKRKTPPKTLGRKLVL